MNKELTPLTTTPNAILLGVFDSFVENNKEELYHCDYIKYLSGEVTEQELRELLHNFLVDIKLEAVKGINLDKYTPKFKRSKNWNRIFDKIREERAEIDLQNRTYNNRYALQTNYLNIIQFCKEQIKHFGFCSIKANKGYYVITKQAYAYYESTNATYIGHASIISNGPLKPSRKYILGRNAAIDEAIIKTKRDLSQMLQGVQPN